MGSLREQPPFGAAHSSKEYSPHHVLDSALSKAALFVLLGPGCLLMPMARAVRPARPV